MPVFANRADPDQLASDQEPAWVVQSDACLTGDQEVVDSIPTGSGNILSWRLHM